MPNGGCAKVAQGLLEWHMIFLSGQQTPFIRYAFAKWERAAFLFAHEIPVAAEGSYRLLASQFAS